MVLFFGRSAIGNVTWQWCYDVTCSAFSFEMLYVTYCLLLCEVSQKSTAYKRNFTISWNFYKKGINHIHALMTGLNAEKFATFWMFPKRFYHSFVLQMTLIHFRRRWTQVLLREFETHQNVSIRVKRNAELFL